MTEEEKVITEAEMETAVESGGPGLSEPVTTAIKMAGKTAALATNGLESVARGLCRTITFTFRKSGMAGDVDPEVQKILRQIDELCLKIGHRIFEHHGQDLATVGKDPEILEIVSRLTNCRERMMALEAKKMPPATESAEPKDEEPAAVAEKKPPEAEEKKPEETKEAKPPEPKEAKPAGPKEGKSGGAKEGKPDAEKPGSKK
ncbi:MAG: hypothetical protein ACYTHM_00810 [Planctomycetota bacterium]|jgi:hypothetical protein